MQGVRLARRLGVQYISTGDLLRTEIAAGSALGSAVERLVAAGRLIPSGLITAIVESNLDGHGYVLDGFPRTVTQAEALFAQPALAPSIALEIVVSERVALGRLGRAHDPTTIRPWCAPDWQATKQRPCRPSSGSITASWSCASTATTLPTRSNGTSGPSSNAGQACPAGLVALRRVGHRVAAKRRDGARGRVRRRVGHKWATGAWCAPAPSPG